MQKIIATALCLTSAVASANVLQYFTGINYSNPAELFQVKKNEFIMGTTAFYVDGEFSGSALNFNTMLYELGDSDTQRTSALPYGRIATRVNDKWVFGVDVTEPFHSNLEWGRTAITRYAATETLMTDVEVSPRFSFSFTRKFYAGAGLNFNFLKNNETNWALPINQTQSATLVNRTSGFGLGFNVGGYYAFNQTNFLGVVYYSAIDQNTRGESLLSGFINNDIRFDFHMPATTVLSYTHIFNEKWLANAKIFRTEWDINQYARIFNTAAQPPLSPNFTFKMKYKASNAYTAAVRRQMSDKLGLTLIGVMDYGPEQDHLRTINFPSDTQYFLALSADYHFNQSTSIELLYGHGYSKTQIDNFVNLGGQSMPFTTGEIHLNADVVDLKLKIQG